MPPPPASEPQRAELLAAEREARAAAERARRRLEILAEAGNELSRSLEEQATLMAIARAIVPGVADWCRIDLFDEHGQMQRKVAHHVDRQKAAQAMDMVLRLRAAPGARGSMGWAAENGTDYHGVFAFPDEPADAPPSNLRLFTETFGMKAYYIVPLVARERILGAMAVIQAESGRDIGERDRALILQLAQRAALALDNARLYAEAERARREAEAASRAKDAFLAMLGHELRNPLAPIASALELLRGGTRQPEGALQVIDRQVAHLAHLVDDLLDVSRIASGKVRIEQAGVDMADVIAQALELAQPRLDASSHAVTLEIGIQPARVRGDAQRLVQVVGNLLSNAAKFTPQGGAITVSLRRAGTAIELAVQDSGEGIAAELLPRIFDAFVQAEQPIAREAGGLGLGLAIARALVEQHGGGISAHSEGPGQGSRFTIRLPEDLSFETVPAAAPVRREPAPPTGARVLLVDDNRDALETLTELLRMRRYDARSAIDGPAALDVVRTFHPDVALLDVGLPGMDGYELARRLREHAAGQPLKLVALTGYGGEGDRERALAAGFHEHLVKPVSVDRLLQVLGPLAPEAPAAPRA